MPPLVVREDTVICPVCEESNDIRLSYTREDVKYAYCEFCGSLVTKQTLISITENDTPELRNVETVMRTRVERVERTQVLNTVIDFGCGKGEFVTFLFQRGYDPIGIDVHTKFQLGDLDKEIAEAAFMVEVIEHLPNPRQVLKELSTKLIKGGILYIETTFADTIKDPSTDPYVDPRIGHRTIISRKGLDLIAADAGLELAEEVNRHVVILRKK